MAIKENFAGYVNIKEKVFFCAINNHTVKLFPKENDDLKLLDDYESVQEQWVFGFDESNYKIALLLQNGIRTHILGLYSWFHTPIIIKSVANLVKHDLNSFDAISFRGGVINSIYNPKVAIKSERIDCDGARTIETMPFDDITHSFPACINGKKADILYSISHDCKDKDFCSSELGALNSFMRIEFEKEQRLESFINYYTCIKDFIAFLVGQHNIEFEVTFHKKREDNKFEKTAICKIYDGYRNYCRKPFHRVIPLIIFDEKLPDAISLFADYEKKPVLSFLPSDNTNLNLIDHSDIQNLCTALEVECNLKLLPLQKDETADKLKKELLVVINKFRKEDSSSDKKLYDKATGTIGYISSALSTKIWLLYQRYKPQIDEIMRKKYDQLGIDELTEDSISKFVKLRNEFTHVGKTAWNDSEQIYPVLQRLLYFAIFERIGFKSDETYKAVYQFE